MTSPQFRRDLYDGTAEYYDSYRPAYPAELIENLAARVGADGTGRLLDLACGTGQVSFALRGRFAEIWAVDQEPDMIRVAGQKAGAPGSQVPSGTARLLLVTSAAEELSAPEQAFDLITIGNAFHRLRREDVAARVRRWLRPGGFLALLWGGGPNDGDAPWQQVLRATMQRWQHRPGAGERIPAGYDAGRRARPDAVILREAGFEAIGRQEFAFCRRWTADEIAGFVASTSVLSPAALGSDAAEFSADLRRELLACQPDGQFRQDATFAYDLARRRPG
jgi:ubiquinone/menaquinone biosynthesis C-methylase UbiE